MKNKLLIAVIILIVVAGGFMVLRSKNTTSSTSTNTNSVYTLSDVSSHATGSDCWMVIDGNVYDVTKYIPQHAGKEILQGCGKDTTIMFHTTAKGGDHPAKAKALLPQFLIGTLSS